MLCASGSRSQQSDGPAYGISRARQGIRVYTVNEHNDGRIALHVKIGEGRQTDFVAADPERFFLPKYMAHHGWVALDFDAAKIDWNEVKALLTESYRLIAPKKLVASL